MVSCRKIEWRAFSFSAGFYLAVAFTAYQAGRTGAWAVAKKVAPGPLNPVELFVHNFFIATLLWAGLFLKGIPTIPFLTLNALIHGFSLGKSTVPLEKLLPYGIFELTAIWIAAGTGLARGLAALCHVNYPIKCALRWVPISIAFLAIAAYLEAMQL